MNYEFFCKFAFTKQFCHVILVLYYFVLKGCVKKFMKNRFFWPVSPKALKKNIIKGKNYRFSVLTSQLIRLEFDPSGKFEDRASQSVFHRDFPETEFVAKEENGILTVETKDLILTYNTEANGFEGALSIKLICEPASTWNFGDDFEDLGGTAKTLDCINGYINLGRGVCSRNGFSIIDDSNRALLGEDGWIEVRNENTTDIYFFGYGFDYLGAVRDLYRLTGAPPMLPAYALGNWWSRYYEYTQESYTALIERFKKEEIPFSVAVIDMDWHYNELTPEDKEKFKDLPNFQSGWTGYTWNKELFPDYAEFLKYLHDNNLRTSLNLHPAQGVRCNEEMFEEMAEAMGVDPKSTNVIPFDVLSPKFMEKYFDILHHKYEDDGVDFWWMDWQQGRSYWWIRDIEPNRPEDKREIVDPLWMLNHLHILDISRSGKRPMFFSRYSGPGSHRYPVGFSGDTFITWDSLQFQPYFTATASNVGYGWWSHDIGGHMCGYRDSDLTTRWMQFGVFSPINRLHSSKDEFIHKEPWAFAEPYQSTMKYWLNFRHRLFPYIYTMNYRNHTELVPLVQPMYYHYPKNSAAYEVKNQFMFGSEIMVSPITEPLNNTDHTSGADTWFPKGDWFDFFNGNRYVCKKNRKIRVYRTINDYPVFAKAGAIVPLANYKKSNDSLVGCDDMEIVVFPGADNSFALYEDAGEGSEYKNGAFVSTEMTLDWGETATFTKKASVGDLSLIPEKRKWTISLRGFAADIDVKAYVDGKEVDLAASHDKSTYTTAITVEAAANEEIKLVFSGEKLIHENDYLGDRINDLIEMAEIGFYRKSVMLERTKRTTGDMLFHSVNGQLGHGPEDAHLAHALEELMTLNVDKYQGHDIGD